MSGGGGSGGMGPVGPQVDQPCGALQFETSLASPRAEVVATLTEGEVLTLELQPAGGGRNMIAALANGKVAGGITDRTPDLIRCIQDGFDFVAEINRIDGGWVELSVHPA
jgi:hypothetical protein